MIERALWLDGNALAGLLQELFATELTDAPHGGRDGSGPPHRPSGRHMAHGDVSRRMRSPRPYTAPR